MTEHQYVHPSQVRGHVFFKKDEIMDQRPFTYCFTGHRNLPTGWEEEIWRRVYACLEPLLEVGVRHFGMTGALGFDTLVAKKQLDTYIAGPYSLSGDACRQEVAICCQTPSREAFLARDRHLMGGSSCCIAWFTRAVGGTAYTLCFAQSRACGCGTSWNQNGLNNIVFDCCSSKNMV
ncbi:hypothetical protein QUW08_14920 [Fournierella massiliensis]|uniref:Uncharacterized protein n=2 Tax=Allofournierella massiliensis TaxID=1650663 RepID=A0ABT7UUJ0_9FIRM|nr:hypothetical protein [Fournierella massiliensis]